jgi:steroid delta-isomerase-like uncharacterized protein
MSTEENKALVRKFYDLWNRGDMQALYALFDEHVVDHNEPPGLPPGLAGFKQGVEVFRAAFPDSKIAIEDLMAAGDKVIDRSTFEGSNTGAMLGIPATGKRAKISTMNAYRIANGKIAEIWHIEDMVGMMAQLGLMPGPGQPA